MSMKPLTGNAVIGQSEDSTSTINATLSGIVKGAMAYSKTFL